MRPEEEEWYIGIELGNAWTMVSCYGAGMKEPETKGLVTGSQSYRIPTAICKKPGISQWYLSEKPEGLYIEHLLERAASGEVIEAEGEYEAKELFLIFLRKIMRMVLPGQGIGVVTKCVFSVEQVNREVTELLMECSQILGMKPEQIVIQDNKESFYAYAVSQERELWLYEVALFSCENQKVTYWEMNHDKHTAPQVSRVVEQQLGELPKESSERDKAFAGMIQKTLSGRIISAVYLIGDGFEGGWMKESLQQVCRGRRAFQGKNLFTKGACYAGVMEVHPEKRETVYFCNYKTRKNICLRASDKDREYMYSLVEAGQNRYQVQKTCCILLEGEPALDVWIQSPGKKEAVIESLELQGLEPAEGKGCRLEVKVRGNVQENLQLTVRDIGLGELLAGSNQEWEYEIG